MTVGELIQKLTEVAAIRGPDVEVEIDWLEVRDSWNVYHELQPVGVRNMQKAIVVDVEGR